MIDFVSKAKFVLPSQEKYVLWIIDVIKSEDFELGEISYIFCEDDFLFNLNKEYLNHDTLTDIITFDYTINKILSAEIFISTERVEDNAKDFNVSFEEELRRVMIHGVLHLMDFKDKSDKQKELMRQKENEKIKMFHVEQ
ncbi:rRNA maturation RNase YbeY [Mesonia sp. K7]|uniref:rRNA maturation RNase YbeY n=1 Tax=Mesonia sp. K7 TaxID=2218606 RepID=UPI000DA98E28|nr:rRNA maturation RNase YbeY [Mesonia sp. K7]PZD79131.1 rRNA maturation RNase YbeY [Mesonia sp. K7]